MGTFHVKFTIKNMREPDRFLELEGLVDTGAHFTQVPASLLEQIGVDPSRIQQVQYADGRVVSKPVGAVEVIMGEQVGPAVVLFGEANDLILLGAATLENFGLGVDPVRKILVPLIVPQASIS